MFVVYQNGDTMVQDFLSGNLDAIYLFPPAQFDKIKSTEGVETREYNFWNWDYVGFNCYDGPSGGHPALKDVAFRSALEYADRSRQDPRERLQRPRHPGLHVHAARHVVRPRLSPGRRTTP